MVAESGATLLDEPARRAVVERLLPRATVITPNLPEAHALAAVAGLDVPPNNAEALARALHGLGPGAVVVTGGHREEATDVYFDGERLELLPGERHADGAAHGSGCTHASSLAAFIALGAAPLEAARAAKKLAAAAVRDGLRELGAGPGPVDVFGLRHRDTLEGRCPKQTSSTRRPGGARRRTAGSSSTSKARPVTAATVAASRPTSSRKPANGRRSESTCTSCVPANRRACITPRTSRRTSSCSPESRC
jgi:hypothetical protein